MPDRLAQAEAMMVAGAAAMGEIRAAFDAFYAMLDEGQRARLDAQAGRWQQ